MAHTGRKRVVLCGLRGGELGGGAQLAEELQLRKVVVGLVVIACMEKEGRPPAWVHGGAPEGSWRRMVMMCSCLIREEVGSKAGPSWRDGVRD